MSFPRWNELRAKGLKGCCVPPGGENALPEVVEAKREISPLVFLSIPTAKGLARPVLGAGCRRQSDRCDLESDVSRGFQKLDVSRDKSVVLSFTRTPHPCSGKLKRVGGSERVASEQGLCLNSQRFTGLQLPPPALQLFHASSRGCVLRGRQLAHAQEPLKGAAHLDWGSPPDRNLMLVKQLPHNGAWLLLDA